MSRVSRWSQLFFMVAMVLALSACGGSDPGESDGGDATDGSLDGDGSGDTEVTPDVEVADTCVPGCGANETCDEPVPGEFLCQCDEGYTKDDAGSCVDEDECSKVPGPCEAGIECTNTVGSFDCDCPDGTSNVEGVCLAPPSEKAAVTATEDLVNRIEVTWTAVEGAEQYRVLRNGTLVTTVDGLSFTDSDAPGGELDVGIISATNQTRNAGVLVTITGATFVAGDVQSYVIVAFNGAGDGPNSDVEQGSTAGGDLTCAWERSGSGDAGSFLSLDSSTSGLELDDTTATGADGELTYRCQFEVDGVPVGTSDAATGQLGTCDDGVLAGEEEFVDCGGTCDLDCTEPVLTSTAGPIETLRTEEFDYEITWEARPDVTAVNIVNLPDWLIAEDTDDDGLVDRISGTPYSPDLGSDTLSIDLTNAVGTSSTNVQLEVRNRRIQRIFGSDVMCADIEGGTTKCWGDNSFGQLGYGHADPISWDATAHHYGGIEPGIEFVEMLPADGWSCFRDAAGAVSCLGGDISIGNFLAGIGPSAPFVVEALGEGEGGGSTSPLPIDLLQPASGMFEGLAASCATLENGDARCWSWQTKNGRTEIEPFDYVVSATNSAEQVTQVTTALGIPFCWVTSGDRVECDFDAGGSALSAQQLPAVPGGAEVEQLGIIFSTGGSDLGFALIIRAGGSVYSYALDDDQWINLGFGNNVEEIAYGSAHICVRDDEGDVSCLGENTSYQLSQGSQAIFGTPRSVSLSGPATSIIAGVANTCALIELPDSVQDVRCWGAGGISIFEYQGYIASAILAGLFGIPVELTHPALNIANAGDSFFGAINFTSSFIEALRTKGSENAISVPVVAGAPRFTTRPSQTAVVGQPWVYDLTFEDGDGDPVTLLTGSTILPEGAEIASNPPAGADLRIEWTPSGRQEGGGPDNRLRIAISDGANEVSQDLVIQVRRSPRVSSVDVGVRHACAIVQFVSETVPTRAFCWGGGAGLGVSTFFVGDDETPRGNAITFGAAFAPIQVAVGESHSCALGNESSSNRVICWGENDHGQLGFPEADDNYRRIPDITDVDSLVAFGKDSNGDDVVIDSIFAGGNHSCALSRKGSLYCWGDNEFGQLGLGDFDDKSDARPFELGAVDFGPSVDIVDVSLGAAHTCAVVEESGEQEVYCWGRGMNGRTAIGSEDQVATPTKTIYSGDADWVGISAGLRNGCAVSDSGRVNCWGEGEFGVIGNALPDDQGLSESDAPRFVGLSDFAWVGPDAVSVGADHACAILADRRRIQCWGYDRLSQPDGDPPTEADSQIGGGKLGLGRIAGFIGDDERPQDTGSARFDDELSGVYAGTNITCATFTNGDLICWGVDQFGGTGSGQRRVYGDNEPLQFIPPVEFD